MGTLTYDVVNTPEALKEVEDFASTFDHKITKKHITMGVRNEKGLIGFVEFLNFPVLLSGWKEGNKKDCVKAIKKISKDMKSNLGDCWCLCPPTSPMYKYMERLGFGNSTLVLFRKM